MLFIIFSVTGEIIKPLSAIVNKKLTNFVNKKLTVNKSVWVSDQKEQKTGVFKLYKSNNIQRFTM